MSCDITAKTPIGGLRCVSLHLLNHSATAVAMLMGTGDHPKLDRFMIEHVTFKGQQFKRRNNHCFLPREIRIAST